jgi:hypothetical protein
LRFLTIAFAPQLRLQTVNRKLWGDSCGITAPQIRQGLARPGANRPAQEKSRFAQREF